MPCNAPLRTRREQAERLRGDGKDFFERCAGEARMLPDDALDRYTEHGTGQLVTPDVPDLAPIDRRGSVTEIARGFGGEAGLIHAIQQLQAPLHAA
jgi:type I restriction enzyme R subunit